MSVRWEGSPDPPLAVPNIDICHQHSIPVPKVAYDDDGNRVCPYCER